MGLGGKQPWEQKKSETRKDSHPIIFSSTSSFLFKINTTPKHFGQLTVCSQLCYYKSRITPLAFMALIQPFVFVHLNSIQLYAGLPFIHDKTLEKKLVLDFPFCFEESRRCMLDWKILYIQITDRLCNHFDNMDLTPFNSRNSQQFPMCTCTDNLLGLCCFQS